MWRETLRRIRLAGHALMEDIPAKPFATIIWFLP